MLVTLSGIVMLAKLLQSENALIPMLVTLPGIVMLVKLLQCSNVLFPMLMTLSGIGQTKADSIIRYREKNGSFSSVEEIKQVEGIKEGVYNRIKDHIKVK